MPALDNSFPGAVEFISYLGSQVDLHVRLSPRDRVIVQIQNRPEQPLPVIGEQVHIGWEQIDRPRLPIMITLSIRQRVSEVFPMNPIDIPP